MSQIVDGKLVDDVKTSIKEKNVNFLMKLIDEMRAADLADLIEHLNSEERLYLFEFMEPKGAGDVLVEIESPVQESILDDLDNEAISEIVRELDSDDAADLVGDLPADRAKQIIETVEDDVSEDLEKLLPYPEDTAGGIMALEFVAVKANDTIQQAIDTIREKREEVQNIYYLFVVDDLHRLAGVISLKDLVLEPPHRKVREIMNPEVISVDVNKDQEEIYHLVKKYDLVSIPVVDAHHRLVGRITHDDIIDVIEEEADEDISLMAGVMDQRISDLSPLRISRARLPWLLMGLLGELVAAVVIYQFENSLEKIVTLACFFPVIMAMGGSTGTQASIVVVRGLATGDISPLHTGKRLWTEIRTALFNGLLVGAILGAIVGIWLSEYRIGLVMCLAMVIIILNAGVIGSAAPLAMKKLNIDPALATGPFVTTSNDILGLLIYLGLITLFLKMTT
jgi:magnesium transporter